MQTKKKRFISTPTFAAQGSRGLLQRLPLGIGAVTDTDVHRQSAAAAAVLLGDEGGRVADGEAGEGAHHENVSLLQQQGGDGIWAHAAKLVLRETKKFDFDTKGKRRLHHRLDVQFRFRGS